MMKTMRLFVLLFLVAIAPLHARAANNEQVASAIEQFITSGQITLGSKADDKRLFQIFTYYQDRDYKPVWTRDDGTKSKGRDLLKILEHAYEHGLDPNDYDIADIKDRIDSTNPEVLAELDLLMSDAFANYGSDLSKGRVEPSEVSSENYIHTRGPGPLYIIDGAEAADNLAPYADSLAPANPRYWRLKDELAAYRRIAAGGGFPKVSDGDTLRLGDSSPRVAELRRFLAATADLPAAYGTGTAFDQSVDQAVKSYQTRHGLTDDGVVGPATVKSMNTPIEKLIRTMELNMERRRWMPADMGQRFIFVNLADQFLKVVQMQGDREKTIHEARVVVGQPYHRTPVFSDDMTYIVFNPYWNVPPSIANNEYLPKLRKNPGALESQNIKLISSSGVVSPWAVDWGGVSRVPYRLRQDPGPKNALGRIKFMFPNKFNVYIHDTPSKSLFSRDQRYFSHGCIRVQDPRALAEILLKDQGWTPQRINAQIDSGERRIVNLRKKLPVHLSYITAWVNKDGSVNFRPDVYGRDKKLDEVMREH